MHRKSETFEKFKEFRVETEKQLGKPIKALRSDCGGEYLNEEFRLYLTDNGILSQLTAPGTLQQNDVAERRNRTMLDMMRSMLSDASLPKSFWGKIKDENVVFLILYVDDILIIGNDVGSLTSVKMWLTKQFQMKDLGEASYVLGIRIFRDRKNKMLALSQASYIDKILEKYDMQDSKKVFTLNGRAIVWRSVKQSCISDSTMEAEYLATSEAVKEAIWLRNFLRDLEVIPNLEQPMVVYCDNSGAVANNFCKYIYIILECSFDP
ncbi:hypothetical protein UlMin_034538 [Ulmus minor]